MHHLRLLGTIDLRDSAGQEVRAVLQQPKRLAVLAWFALEPGERYVRRDTILALFWPELDQSRARAALRRAIYFLRQALGDDIIEGRGDEELRLGTGTLTCDAAQFRLALATGDHARARALYAGALLEGFYIAGAPEAEEWLDRTRRTLTIAMEQLGPTAPMPAIPAPAIAPSRATIAVTPFTIHGGTTLEYLGEGLMDLFRTALDGLGNYHTLDPRVIVDSATHTLNGALHAAGGRIRLTVQLRNREGRVVGRAETRADDEALLFELVDDAVRQLVVELAGGPPERLTRLATQTTSSWPALRAWLEGERQFRLGSYGEALGAYLNAVMIEPDFPLAHYRIASSSAAMAMIGPARTGSERAYAQRERLVDRDRLLVEAQHAWLHGDVHGAERRYQAIVTAHPDDVEAWSLLGDLLLHHNPYRGQSIRAARQPLEQALQLDADHVSTLTKLARLDALELQHDLLQQRVARVVALSPAGDRAIGLRLLRAVATHDEQGQAAIIAELRDVPALTLAIAYTDVALYGGDAAATGRLGAALTEVVRSPELQALCFLVRAHHAAGMHGLDEAEALLQRGTTLDYNAGITNRALLHALPFLPWPEGTVAATMDLVQQWDPASAPASVALPLSLHNHLYGHARAWLLGLLAARQGKREEVASALEELSAQPVEPDDAVLAQRLERSLTAELQRLQGDLEGALATLAGARTDLWFQYAVASPLYCGVFERWRRGMLLGELGKKWESAQWLDTLAERSPWELAFAGVRT